jgi:hypothetical protein
MVRSKGRFLNAKAMETAMRFVKRKKLLAKICTISISALLVMVMTAKAQNQSPEQQTTTIRLGRLWLGMTANGGNMNFNPAGGFFPNDYGIAADQAQYAQGYTGAGIQLTAVHWLNPFTDSIETAAVYAFVSDSMPVGRVVVPITNYLRYKYPQMNVGGSTVVPQLFGTYNPSYDGFQNHTYDEVADVVDSTIFGVEVERKVYAWSQNFNDNYVITDLFFTNVGKDTLDSMYVNLQETGANFLYSNGRNPSGTFDETMVWQHYYGGRPGDSLRVFYEYSADNPQIPGDDMGAPQVSQNGRLLNPNMLFYTILHASVAPFTDSSQDVDDPLQPKVTYCGVATAIPYSQTGDPYGSKSFFAIRGGYSDAYPMAGAIQGTHHGVNSDEWGSNNYSSFPGGQVHGISYRSCSFGPYTFYPGQHLHIVIASGVAGIGYEMGQKIGEQWLSGTLQDPPNASSIPGWNLRTGLFPSNFQFPTSNSVDQAKDRWLSLGIDSVMLSAWRAKWNYEHNYSIPQAPPPPQSVNITANPWGVSITWSDPQAEAMPNFAGYRVMRRVSNFDTVFYQPVYNSDSTDIAPTHTFNDSIRYYGAQVYYYIQSKARIGVNDPNADPTTRGQIMYSGRTLYPNLNYVQPTNYPQNDLSKIRIVPNPYNIKDPLLTSQIGLGTTNGNEIVFYNLPAVCTIKIYTENGDLVQTIQHPQAGKPQSGTDTWNLQTRSQQTVYSGVYIVVFQTPDGAVSYQKCVIVR